MRCERCLMAACFPFARKPFKIPSESLSAIREEEWNLARPPGFLSRSSQRFPEEPDWGSLLSIRFCRRIEDAFTSKQSLEAERNLLWTCLSPRPPLHTNQCAAPRCKQRGNGEHPHGPSIDRGRRTLNTRTAR